MKAINTYAFLLGQVISLACLAALIHVAISRDAAEHPTYILAGFALAGQLPLLFILRANLVTTGRTLGQFVKDAVLPVLPWGKKNES